jgi:ABC-type lipoprotein release transport system permease subunit
MTLFKLAWRNLGRNRRRTALMIAMVALGTWAIVVLWGLTEGFFKTMIESQVRLDTGDLQIHRAGFLEDPDLERALDEAAIHEIRRALARHPQVEAVSLRLKTEGLLKSAYGATGVEIRGVEPLSETQVTQIAEALVEGRFLREEGEIVLGRPLAHDLDVRLDERVVLEAQGLNKPASRAFRVVGIVSTGLALLDRAAVWIPLEDAQALAGLAGATEVAISLKPGASPERIAAKLRKSLDNSYSASTILEINPLLANIIKISYIEMTPTMLVLALLAGFGVANTVMFTVLERTREFGVLIALGLKPKRLARLVLAESVLASAMGFALGALAGYAVNAYLALYGMDLGFYADAFPDLGMPRVIYAATSGWYWLYGIIVVVLTALVAAWYPARRAAALEPTEAMRHV